MAYKYGKALRYSNILGKHGLWVNTYHICSKYRGQCRHRANPLLYVIESNDVQADLGLHSLNMLWCPGVEITGWVTNKHLRSRSDTVCYEDTVCCAYIVRYAITKTYLYNFDPLKPHFYIVKLEFTGVYIIFLISAQKHRLWVLVRTASARWF